MSQNGSNSLKYHFFIMKPIKILQKGLQNQVQDWKTRR